MVGRETGAGADRDPPAGDRCLRTAPQARRLPAGDPLLPTSTATTVRMRNGKPVTTDGPFAETKEQLGGYTNVEVAGLDEALAIAADYLLLRVGGHSIEVRPIRELPPPAVE